MHLKFCIFHSKNVHRQYLSTFPTGSKRRLEEFKVLLDIVFFRLARPLKLQHNIVASPFLVVRPNGVDDSVKVPVGAGQQASLPLCANHLDGQ